MATQTLPAPRESAPQPSLQSWLVPFLCFFLSGASGLIFEVIWTRELSLVFGATTPAISTVLSAFMGGLALGSYLLGRTADRLRFPILTYAVVEAGVGFFALLVPPIVRGLYPPVSHWVTNHGGNNFGWFTLLRFFVVALILLPPTTLMGATLPFLARHFVRHGGGLGQRVGALYAVNTFGAVAGTFAAGFLLLPSIGLTRTNAVAAGLNLTLSVLILVFRKALLGNEWPSHWRELLPVPAGTSADPTPEPAPAPAVEEKPAPAAETPDEKPARANKKKRRKAEAEGDDKPAVTAEEGKPAAAAQSEESLLDEPVSQRLRYAALLTAAGSGFAALAYENILTRALDMVIGSSVYSFTIILMAFLVGIGGGSALTSAILRARPKAVTALGTGGAFLFVGLLQWLVYTTQFSKMIFVLTAVVVLVCVAVALTWRRPSLALGSVQLLIGVAAACTYYFQDKVPKMFVYLAMVLTDSCDPARPLRFSTHVGTIMFVSFLVALLCALPAAIGMGASFPLSVRAYARGLDRVGGDTGAVYSVNTLGSIVGSFLSGFVLLPLVGMETAFYAAVTVNLALALVLFLTAPGEEPSRYILVPIAAVLLAIAATGTVLGHEGRRARAAGDFSVFPRPWNRERMTLGVFRLSLADGMIARRNNQCSDAEESEREHSLSDDNPVYYRDGITTTVTVERWTFADRVHLALKNNGKVDASNGDDMPTQVLVGALPLIMHNRGPRDLDVALVGWGSGVTVGSVMQFPVRRLDVIELERATIDASRYFTTVNHLPYNLPEFPYVSVPRLNIHNNDGRNYLAATDRRYDVVISEPSNPWITGVSNLFTLDNFRSASRSLAPGGIFLQWVQLYELSPTNVKTLLRTFSEVFPYVRVFIADAYSADAIMVGSFSPMPLDVGRIDRYLASDAQARAVLEPAHIRSAGDLFARLLFSSRDEVRQFSQLEEHLEGGRWVPALRANGSEPCEPAACRRSPAVVNTDDNAHIEFAAPRDLIGFDAFAGYTESFFTDGWPYGRAERELVNLGDGAERVANLSRFGVSLLLGGRPFRAGVVLTDAGEIRGPDGQPLRTPEWRHQAALWAGITGDHLPALHLEPPRAGTELSAQGERHLREAFEHAVATAEQGSFRTALAQLQELQAPVRESAGPSMRLLYAYLLYRASTSEGAEERSNEAAEQLDHLVHDEPEWSERHPEVWFYLSRARFRSADFRRSVESMERYLESLRHPVAREHERPEVDRADVPEPDVSAPPVSDAPGELDKSGHNQQPQ